MSVIAALRYTDESLGAVDNDAAYNDMYYMGKGIPSRSFHLLQDAVGNDPHVIAVERRRRRRNEVMRQASLSQEDISPQPDASDFDEDAYLSGNIPINITSSKPQTRSRSKECSQEKASWQKDDGTEPNQFDEDAYLTGRIPVISNEPKQPFKPLVSEMVLPSLEAEPENKEPFDEDAYLAGKVPLLGGEPKPRPATGQSTSLEKTSWQKDESEGDKTEQQFDENAYLEGKLNLIRGEGPNVPVTKEKPVITEEPEWAKKRRDKMQRGDSIVELERFENANYLDIQNQSAQQTPEDDVTKNEAFDENAFLAGKVNILGCGENLPPRVPKPASSDDRPSWQKGTETGSDDKATFDEDAYLRGRVPILRDSVDRELPPRKEFNKPKQYRERASWERSLDDEDTSCDQQGDFNENRYLAGKVPTTVRKSLEREITSPAANGNNNNEQFSNIPSRTFHYLRRSMSREGSPPMSPGRPSSRHGSIDSGEDENDSNRVYNEMMYVGKSIPSKTFHKLKQSIAKRPNHSKQKMDPIEHLKMKSIEGCIDIDSAMDKLYIDSHDPDIYLEQLKESVKAANNLKIEADSTEVTDF